MKKIINFASALLMFAGALVSCTKENLVETPVGPTSFTASFEPSTKVTIDGYTPKFEVGDVLYVSDGRANATFAVSSVSADGKATFDIQGNWSSTPMPPYYVSNVVPNYGIQDDIMMGVPAPKEVLNAKSNSISLAALVAKTDNLENVTLLNATALLKITVESEVKAIKFIPSSVDMYAEADVCFSGDDIALDTYFAIETATEVKYTSNDGEKLPAGTYYLPVIPQDFFGLKVGCTTDGAEYTWKEKKSNFTLERNKIYDLGVFGKLADPEPVYSVEDFIGTYEGTSGMGLQIGETGTPGINQQETTSFVIEASDDASKGNLKFTKFDDVNCAPVIYCTVDLITGNITIPANSVFQSEQGPALSDRPVVLVYNAETKGYTCSAIVNQMVSGYFKGIVLNIAPAAKQEPETGVSAKDFVGSFAGGLKEDLYIMGGYAQTTYDGLTDKASFVIEEGTSENTVVLKQFFSKDCELTGTFSSTDKTVTFSTGSLSVYAAFNLAIKTPLVLAISEDKTSLTQVGEFSIGSAAPEYKITLSALVKTAAPGAVTFELADVADFKWELSYDVDGNHYIDEDTFSFTILSAGAAASYGANLYASGVGGQNKSFVVNLDEATGEMTIPADKVSGLVFSGIVEYDDKGDRLRVPRNLSGNVVMQMADDKNTFGVASMALTANETYHVGAKTLTNVTFTKKAN